MTVLRRFDFRDWLLIAAVLCGGGAFLLTWPPGALFYVAGFCIGLFLLDLLREARR